MKKNNISTLPKKTNTHYIENIYKLSLDYKWLSLADVNLDDVSKFNDLVGKFSLLGTGTFDGNKNTETLKKFIIYISTYINTERYCEDIIKYIDKIDVDFEKKYIDNILAKKFDKDVLEDFIKIVKFIKGKKEHFKNNQNKFVAEDAQKVEDIFIKDSTAQKSFMKYLGNPKKAAMALLLVAPFISQALWDISDSDIHKLYISETQQNISQTMSLLDKDFENQSYKIKIIYEKLAKFWVYETEELKNIQILQSKISEINLQKIETQAQIDFIKNDANFIDYIKETRSEERRVGKEC